MKDSRVKFTAKQKIRILKKAIQLLKSEDDDCICNAVASAIRVYHWPTYYLTTTIYIPELLKYKPKRRIKINAYNKDVYYWFKDGDIKSRIEVLQKTIKDIEATL